MNNETQELWAEVSAIQYVLLAMIKAHPAPGDLLAILDALVSGVQTRAALEGLPPPIPERLRVALQRYRSQLGDDAQQRNSHTKPD